MPVTMKRFAPLAGAASVRYYYLEHNTLPPCRAAMAAEPASSLIRGGPRMGAFREQPRNRAVVSVALNILEGTAVGVALLGVRRAGGRPGMRSG
jgi:hypothetical protein